MNSYNMEKREVYLDNLKGLLIILVVLGHFLGTGKEGSIWAKSLILVIYSFHMPLFSFISGYFSKNLEKAHGKAKHLISLLIIAQLAWTIFKYLIDGSNYYLNNIYIPGYALWYLAALIIWRFTLKYYVRLPRGAGLLISMIISVAIMFIPGSSELPLGLERVIGYYIFFLLGYYCPKEMIIRIRKLPSVIAATLLSCSLLVTAFVLKKGMINYGAVKDIFSHQREITAFSTLPRGIVSYILAVLLAIILGVSIMVLIPRRKGALSYVGQDTLPLYLTHTYFVDLSDRFIPQLIIAGTTKRLLLIAMTVVTVIVFSNKFYRSLFHSILKKIT